MEIKTISKISFSKLTNPLHVAFMNTIIGILNDFGAGRLGMKETLLDSFTKIVGEEQLIVSRSRASMHTKELDAYDAQRDNYFRAVISIGGRANEFIDEEVDEMAKMEIEKCADCLSKLNQAIKEFKWKYNSTSPDVDPDADLSELAENTEDAENSVND